MKHTLFGVFGAALILAPVVTMPAQARSTQEDIQLCRDALVEKGELNMDEYRLSFERKRGNSNRTLWLEAIPHAGGEKFAVTCTLAKSEVTEVTVEQA